MKIEKEEFGLIMEKNMKQKSTLTKKELFMNFIDGLIVMAEGIKLIAGLMKKETISKLTSGKMEMDVSMRFTDLQLPMEKWKKLITERINMEQ